MESIPCAGCLVFFEVINSVSFQLIKVSMNIPEAKQNSGEDLMTCVLRALEETRIRSDQIAPLKFDKYIDKVSRKGRPSIRLFVTELIPKYVELDQWIKRKLSV